MILISLGWHCWKRTLLLSFCCLFLTVAILVARQAWLDWTIDHRIGWDNLQEPPINLMAKTLVFGLIDFPTNPFHLYRLYKYIYYYIYTMCTHTHIYIYLYYIYIALLDPNRYPWNMGLAPTFPHIFPHVLRFSEVWSLRFIPLCQHSPWCDQVGSNVALQGADIMDKNI